MNKLIVLVLLLVSMMLAACTSGSGGSDSSPDNEASDSGTGEDNVNSGGTGSGGTVSPSTATPTPGTVPSGETDNSDGSDVNSHEIRFLNRLVSSEDFNFWGCFTEESDNTLVLILYQDDASQKVGFFGINVETSEDYIEISWRADANTLTLSDNVGSARFSDYTFESDFVWRAEFNTGDFTDQVACGLFDQDGQFLGDTDPQDNGGDSSIDHGEKFLNRNVSDDDFNAWACTETETPSNTFNMALLRTEGGDGVGAFIINGGDAIIVSWAASEADLVLEDNAGETVVFSDYNFSDPTDWTATLEFSFTDYSNEVGCILINQDGQKVD